MELPEKVDLLVAEVIGSVATEEGVYRTIKDAQQRFLKTPEDPASYIPLRVQTLMAPASYAFHYMIAAEGRRAAGLTSDDGPLRLNCTDQTLEVMDDPQVFEDFRFAALQNRPCRWAGFWSTEKGQCNPTAHGYAIESNVPAGSFAICPSPLLLAPLSSSLVLRHLPHFLLSSWLRASKDYSP